MQNETNNIARNKITEFMEGTSLEVTPSIALKTRDFSKIMNEKQRVFVTFLPGSNINDTINAVIKLHNEGMIPIPHLAARSIKSSKQLDEILQAITKNNSANEVLLIAGSVDNPVGEFNSSIDILNSRLLEKYNINNIGVAGHPEGSPDISNEQIMDALLFKNEFAAKNGINMYINTQFLFHATPALEWEKKLRDAGNKLPIHIGLAGLSSLKNLIKYARLCGVGNSVSFISRQASNITKLLRVHAPDDIVLSLANSVVDDNENLIKGACLYPLGGLEKTIKWLYKTQQGDFIFNKDGFVVK